MSDQYYLGRQKLITEIIDFHSAPDEFPRGHESREAGEVLEYIETCESMARSDERKRIAAALLGNDHLSFCVVDEVIGRVEASGALQISPSEWQPIYDAPGAQEAVKAIFDDYIREEVGISTEEES